MELKYVVWKMNRFNSEIKTALVAKFEEFEYAQDFVDYQLTLSEEFAVFVDNVKIYPFDEF